MKIHKEKLMFCFMNIAERDRKNNRHVFCTDIQFLKTRMWPLLMMVQPFWNCWKLNILLQKFFASWRTYKTKKLVMEQPQWYAKSFIGRCNKCQCFMVSVFFLKWAAEERNQICVFMFHRCLFLYAVGMLEWNSLTAVSSLFFPLLKSRIVSELTFFLTTGKVKC